MRKGGFHTPGGAETAFRFCGGGSLPGDVVANAIYAKKEKPGSLARLKISLPQETWTMP
jgi:hypothetical protein